MSADFQQDQQETQLLVRAPSLTEGYSSGEEAARAFQLRGLYPMALAEGCASPESLAIFAWWLGRLGKNFSDISQPWLPLGRVGPVLILGHYSPIEAQTLLPVACYQPVLLGRDDYLRAFEFCRDQLARRGRKQAGAVELVEPRSVLRGSVVAPATDQGALQFLIEYFPLEPEAHRRLSQLVQEGFLDGALLPDGYRAAIRVLTRRGASGDPSILQIPSRIGALSTASLPPQLVPVAEYGKNLWLASSRLPQAAAEDRLLNELGEGWRLHLILAEGIASSSSKRSGAGEEGNSGAGTRRQGRQRLKLETRPTVPSVGPLSGAGQQGEIRLSERDLAELERYDPRRPDRDPAKVFLRSLVEAARCGASDLHLEPGLERDRVRVRIDGVLEEWLEMGCDFGQTLIGAAKELLGLPAERFLPQDGACTLHMGSESCSLRVSSYPIRKRRQKLVLRLLPRRGRAPLLDELMPAREASLLRRASLAPSGLILVCGPTGSGKTTTVFSALSELNTPERNISTMEDPVEYEVEGLNQAELDERRGVSWEPLLRGFLRQDPDAGLIGEIRDKATAETALRQALTGHVVFATLHTMSCARTIERLADMGVNVEMLASALTLVVGQRLVRRLCPGCRSKTAATRAEKSLFEAHDLTAPPELWRPRTEGCPACRRGYKGRAAALEMLPVTREVEALIEAHKRASAFEDWAREHRLPTVFESALDMAARGITSLDEAREWQPVWDDFDLDGERK
jgi:protein transport protein HofB